MATINLQRIEGQGFEVASGERESESGSREHSRIDIENEIATATGALSLSFYSLNIFSANI